jgi:trimeric autotransporter adhesin
LTVRSAAIILPLIALLVGLSFCSPQDARAQSDYVLDGSSASAQNQSTEYCADMGGSWSNESVFGSGYAGGSCTIVGSMSLASGITLTIEPDAALLIGSSQAAPPTAVSASFTINENASINNYGTIDNNDTAGVITNEATINNYGTFNNNGTIDNLGGDITNAGHFYNAGTIDNDVGCTIALDLGCSFTNHVVSTLNNDGAFTNLATINNYGGNITNSGDLANVGAIVNDVGCTLVQDAGCTALGNDVMATLTNEPGGIITNNHEVLNSAAIANYGLISTDSCLRCILIYGPNSASLINSGTLTEYCGSVTIGAFSGEIPVTACPLIAQRTSTTSMTGGAASSNQTSSTGISVTISGSSAADGTSVTISAEDLSSAEQNVAPSGLGSPRYYDVSVFGIPDGTALVCVPNAQPPSSLIMQYWDGSGWVPASGITVSGSEATCGDIPVSALAGTNIASGMAAAITPASNATTTTTQTVTMTSTTTITLSASTSTSTLPASTSTSTTTSTVQTTITITESTTTSSTVTETTSVVPTWGYGVMAVLLLLGLAVGYLVSMWSRTTSRGNP